MPTTPRRRGILRTSLAAALTVVLAGCGGGVVGANRAAEKSNTITVAMHFNIPQVSWVGFYMAQHKGYYAKAGLKVKFQYLKGTTLAVQSVATGKTPVGVAAPDGVLAGASKGLPIKAVANNIQRDGTGVIVRGKDVGGGLAALRGKTVATAQASADSAMLKANLTKKHLDGDVEVINVDPQAKCTLVLSKKADACTGFSYAQYVQVRQSGAPATFIPFSTTAKPLPGNMVIANKRYLADNGGKVKKFLAATAKGYEAAQADPKQATELMERTAKNTPKKEVAETVPRVLELSRGERSEQHGWGWMDDETWQNLADELVAGEVLTKAPNPSTVYTNDYLPTGG